MFLISKLNHGAKLSNAINNFNINVKLMEQVLDMFPDATLVKESSTKFSFMSKHANKLYNHIEFDTYSDLWAYPFYKFRFKTDDYAQDILVHTDPKKVMLVRRNWYKDGLVISFPSTKKNAKKSKFDQNKLFKDCKVKIVSFLQEHKNFKIDTLNADQDLIKLLNIM